LKLITYSI